jgi:hypothetical protein
MGMKISDKLKYLLQPKEKESETRPSESAPEPIKYNMPEPENYDLYDLDPLAKRKMTICNLFANHARTVLEISDLLEASRKLVIDTLIENKLLKDRRLHERPRTLAPEEIRMK